MNKITINETTYQFKSKWVATSEGNFEDYDILINGKKSNYELQSGYWETSNRGKEQTYILFRNGYGTGCDVKNPQSIVDMAKVISMITYYESLNNIN